MRCAVPSTDGRRHEGHADRSAAAAVHAAGRAAAALHAGLSAAADALGAPRTNGYNAMKPEVTRRTASRVD